MEIERHVYIRQGWTMRREGEDLNALEIKGVTQLAVAHNKNLAFDTSSLDNHRSPSVLISCWPLQNLLFVERI